MVSQKII